MLVDVLEPLAVSAILVPDMSDGDWDRAIEEMWTVNCLASQVLSGDRPVDDLLDAVQSAGADVDTTLATPVPGLTRRSLKTWRET